MHRPDIRRRVSLCDCAINWSGVVPVEPNCGTPPLYLQGQAMLVFIADRADSRLVVIDLINISMLYSWSFSTYKNRPVRRQPWSPLFLSILWIDNVQMSRLGMNLSLSAPVSPLPPRRKIPRIDGKQSYFNRWSLQLRVTSVVGEEDDVMAQNRDVMAARFAIFLVVLIPVGAHKGHLHPCTFIVNAPHVVHNPIRQAQSHTQSLRKE